MSKDFQPNIVKTFIITTVFVLIYSIGVCQRAKPKMWVQKKESKDRATSFQGGFLSGSQFKYKLLTEKIKKAETVSIFYPLQKVIDLLNMMKKDCNTDFETLRIYIAAYNSKYGSNYFDAKNDSTLTIIFAPADYEFKDLNQYYILDKDTMPVKITPQIKESWIDFYIEEKMPLLLTTIDATVKENYRNGNYHEPFSDTKSLVYELADIDDFLIDEVCYQDSITPKKKITGIEINFAAFTKNGIPTKDFGPNSYTKRLLIQFEYTKKNNSGKNVIFYIDDQPHFRDRPLHNFSLRQEENSDTKSKNSSFAFDHGDLCPPKICN